MGSELIGVCIAADPVEKRGIFTALKPVAELLCKAHLRHLAPSYLANEESLAGTDSATLGAAVGLNDGAPRRSDDEFAGLVESATRTSEGGSDAPVDLVGAEIVCIVRPKTAGGISRVVIVNQASSRFVDDLLHESGGSRQESNTAKRTNTDKRSSGDTARESSRMAMQKPEIKAANGSDSGRQIETSFEPKRYRRNRE